MNRKNRIRDDDAFDADDVLRDGFSCRVAMTARDRRRRDAEPKHGANRVSMTNLDVERPPTGQGERGQRGAKSGDLCMIDGNPGRLDADLVCVPDRKAADSAQFTDGRTDDPTALNRPGFRVPVVNDRRAVHDAYAQYQTKLVNAYKLKDDESICPNCGGEGYINGKLCQRCDGEGVIDDDDRDDPVSDKRTVQDAYLAYDHDLENSWKRLSTRARPRPRRQDRTPRRKHGSPSEVEMLELTQEIVRELLDYDPATGSLTWRTRDRKWFKFDRDQNAWNKRFAGQPALTYCDDQGYLCGKIFGKLR
jgi:hypothetical protein